MRSFLVALCVPSQMFARAQRPSAITTAEPDGDLRYLSSYARGRGDGDAQTDQRNKVSGRAMAFLRAAR